LIEPRVNYLGNRNGGYLVSDGSDGIGLQFHPFGPALHSADDILFNISEGQRGINVMKLDRLRIAEGV